VDQVWPLPPSVHDFVPAGHSPRLVRRELDLPTIVAAYAEEWASRRTIR
jgi:hypothetical protein